MRCFAIILSVITALVTSYSPATADTRYVGDELVITLRQGQSTKHKILKTLSSGTSVAVLEEGDPYLKVRTEDGVEGYVLAQYITAELPKSVRLKELEKDNKRLLEKITGLEKTKNNLQDQLGEIREKYDREFSGFTAKSTALEQDLEQILESERQTAEKYNTLLADSENVLEIVKERDFLRQKTRALQTTLKEQQARNEQISDTRMIKWFLAGAGVFFFGWLIGKISRKRRHRF